MGRHKEFDVDQALEAALSLFWTRGYEGTSMDDLTKVTGVAPPGLYAAFGNKKALFLRALDRYDSTYMGFMSEALKEPTSLKVVERILRGSVDIQTRFSSRRGCLGLNGALACSADAEPIRKELIRRRSMTEAALKRRLEQAQVEKDLPTSADCGSLAAYVMAVSQGTAVQAKAGANPKMLYGIVRHVLATWPTGSKIVATKQRRLSRSGASRD